MAKKVKEVPKIPERLYQAIDRERYNLAKASALLACVALAIETDSGDAPDYGEVVKIADEMIRASIDRLDFVILKRAMQGGKDKAPRGRRKKKATSKVASR